MTSIGASSPIDASDAADSAPAVLVVDGANVVGARADGWWRDRAAAAGRLHRQLAATDLGYRRVVLVLEGRARPGVAQGVMDGGHALLETVHAPGEGDDEIVAQATSLVDTGCAVTVVTADRELRARIEVFGGQCAGPSWLLARIC